MQGSGAAVRMGQMFAAGLILMMECADNLLDYSLNFPAEFWARVRPQWGQCLFEIFGGVKAKLF